MCIRDSFKYNDIVKLARTPKLVSVVNAVRVVKGIKAFSFKRFRSIIEKITFNLRINAFLTRMLLLFITLLILTHCFACFIYIEVKFINEQHHLYRHKLNLRIETHGKSLLE
eukprot:TRINITY_DN19276_c0_g1_i1.p1 TRINITY_DN19276_c0_g1~~TRINITY_DN19276_c0_g1_i1.p1  ORF type:complete len:130 (-),score=12.85 TRINITY_DN19276_c0_g1_i1:122-457(-)